MKPTSTIQRKLAKGILALYPLFPVPIYFSVLIGYPALWLSLVIAIIPMVVHYWKTRLIIKRTPFDIPILIFICGTLISFIVAPDKSVATGALSTTIASILVYYGITTNSGASKKYWLWTAGIICLITLLLSLWFLSQGEHRILPFNQWAFDLFSGFPKTVGPVLQWNTIGALLAVVIPPLFIFVLFKYSLNIRVIALILWLFFSGVLFLSDSGAGWLAFIISLAFILICWRKHLLLVIVPILGILSTTAVIFYSKTDWLITTFSTASLIGRTKLWQNTFMLLKGKSSVLGLGPGAWHEVYNSHYGDPVPIVHNSYLQLYCDAGLLGFIAMVLAAIIVIRLSIQFLNSSWRNSVTWIGIGLIGSIIAGAIFAIFDTTISETYVTSNGYIYLVLPLLWIGAALIAVVHKTRCDTLEKIKKSEHGGIVSKVA